MSLYEPIKRGDEIIVMDRFSGKRVPLLIEIHVLNSLGLIKKESEQKTPPQAKQCLILGQWVD